MHVAPLRLATRQLALLVVGVSLAHWAGLTWLINSGLGPAALVPMAEPEFTRALSPSSVLPLAAEEADLLPPPTSTVGQVLQARTVVLQQTAARNTSARPKTPPAKPADQPDKATPTNQATSTPNTWLPTPAVHDELVPQQAVPPLTEAPVIQPPLAEVPLTPPEQATVSTEQAFKTSSAQDIEQKPQPALNGIGSSALINETSSNKWLASWPASTRLSYKLQGYFRGEFSGNARVQWQRSAERYQAQVDVNVALLLNMRMTSQGRITPTHLWPESYEEDRRGKRRIARFGDQVLQLDDGRTLPRPAHLQDAASQFVQLAQDFATGRSRLAVGEIVRLTMGRPGGVDDWTYDVVAQDTLDTPLGKLQAFHLKPRPLANPRGKVYAEMWFAPALQHLPARIKLTMNEEIWLDLTLASVAQSP